MWRAANGPSGPRCRGAALPSGGRDSADRAVNSATDPGICTTLPLAVGVPAVSLLGEFSPTPGSAGGASPSPLSQLVGVRRIGRRGMLHVGPFGPLGRQLRQGALDVAP